ncbi:MAG: prophage maintenance system killer protein/predicted XRE-type DNA-binding protein [Lysobacterales bacterium]|jgi:prophage maintenance system killer protein/predicted XRE-type DNA-binding protein
MTNKANNLEETTSKVVRYKNKISVNLDLETVWLTQAQIAELFGTKRPAITKHLSNIFNTNELAKFSVCSKMEHTASDGKKYKTKFYNLDAIISVGYRVNSNQATRFRIWATKLIKQHLKEKYAKSKKQDEKFLEIIDLSKLLKNILNITELPTEAKGIIQVISEYTKALDLLDDFDHEKLSIPKGTKKAKFKLSYNEARKVIEAMKRKFKDSDLVGQEKDKSFQSSIGAIYQTFGKKDVYPTVEEKASHLLYFVTKNHSFIDGNKRIAAALFVCFLQKNGIILRKNGQKRINNNTLVALTLMVASSKPSEKDILIKVILNLLK